MKRWQKWILGVVIVLAVAAGAFVLWGETPLGPAPEAAYVQARADGNYTANLRLVDLLGDKAFVATDYDGKPLAEANGGPARLVDPGLYFWKSAKWLRGLHFSQFDYKGYWEKLGYHNYGDPWKEQRYRG